MWNLICIILLFTILVLSSIIIFMDRKRRRLANQIPGPKGSFLVGVLPLFLQANKIMKTIPQIYQMYEQSTFKFWILNNLYIFITQPEDIEFVLRSPKLLLKSKEYEAAKSVLGQGVFSTNDVDKWKKNRKIVMGGLKFTALKSFIPIFYEESIVLNKIIHKNCDLNSKECEISIPIGMATMEMIGRAALDVKFNAQIDNSHRFVENMQLTFSIWEYRISHPWYLNKTIFRLSSLYKKQVKSQQIINEFADQLIREKLAEFHQNGNDKKKENTAKTNIEDYNIKPITIIETLLMSHNEMSHEQMRNELVTIIAAGQDTTATTNALVLYILANFQDIQQKVFEELHSIFSIGDYERIPTYEDLLKMEYLERVIKETMRVFPPAPLFARKLEEDMQIGKYLCPAGSTLVIASFGLHRSSQYYTDPLKFNPDNFLPDECDRRHPYAFLPFSAGLRNCIGSKYAMMQIKTVLSTLLRNNKFYPSERIPSPDRLRMMFSITNRFVDKCYVKIERRT